MKTTENNPPLTIGKKKQSKLISNYPKYLKSKQKALVSHFGEERAKQIVFKAEKAYPGIVSEVHTFKTPMYDALMVTASKMAALKKGMNAAGISTEEFVKFNIEQTRLKSKKAPIFIRRMLGKFYLSKPMRKYLNGVAKNVTKNGWPTTFINGTKHDDFVMSVETRNCQMLAFFESIGESDIKPYCTFFDFTSAEALGIGLKQVSDIDSGVCKYCFYRKGKVEWPDQIKQLFK
jgi:hypothetical protein